MAGIDADVSMPAGMDDADDNLIVLTSRQLAAEELREAAAWLEDLDAPLAAELRALMQQDLRERRDCNAGLLRRGKACDDARKREQPAAVSWS